MQGKSCARTMRPPLSWARWRHSSARCHLLVHMPTGGWTGRAVDVGCPAWQWMPITAFKEPCPLPPYSWTVLACTTVRCRAMRRAIQHPVARSSMLSFVSIRSVVDCCSTVVFFSSEHLNNWSCYLIFKNFNEDEKWNKLANAWVHAFMMKFSVMCDVAWIKLLTNDSIVHKILINKNRSLLCFVYKLYQYFVACAYY